MKIDFGQAVVLLLLAAGLFFGVQYMLDETRVDRAEDMVEQAFKADSSLTLEQMEAHVDRCLKQGHKGNGC